MDKKKIDPGWNDPPTINYSASNPPPKSRITNKRVAFPLSNNCSNPKSTQLLPSGLSSSQQPPSVSQRLPPVQTSAPLGQDNISSTEDTFKIVKENFTKLILNSDIQINEELVLLLYKQWEEGKFSVDCQNDICLLSKFLVQGDKIAAQQIKEKLLTEFKDLCEEWLNGIVT